MPLSTSFKKNINTLSNLNPTKKSVSFHYEQDDFVVIKKRSRTCFHNFFYRFIHLITFTFVPRNWKLDKVTSNILAEFQKINLQNDVTEKEKILFNKAIENLSIIIKRNGGCKRKKIENLLSTIGKIKAPLNKTIDYEIKPIIKENESKPIPKKIPVNPAVPMIHFAQEFEQLCLDHEVPPAGLLQYIEWLPPRYLERISSHKLIEMSAEAIKLPENPFREKILFTILDALEKNTNENFFYAQKHLYARILPFFSEKAQIQFVSLLLKDPTMKNPEADVFLEKARKLPLKIWEKAGKNAQDMSWDIKILEPQLCASILNGKIEDRPFINKFMIEYFENEEMLDKQKSFLDYLLPHVFSTKNFNPRKQDEISGILDVIKMTTDEQKLKHLLEGPLKIENVEELIPGKGYLEELFDYLETVPLKFLLLLDDQRFNHGILKDWLVNHSTCRECFDFYEKHDPLFWKQAKEHINNFFSSAKKNEYIQAYQSLNKLDQICRTLLIEYDNPQAEELVQDLSIMEDGQVFARLLEGIIPKDNLEMALESGYQNLSYKRIKRIWEIQGAVHQFIR